MPLLKRVQAGIRRVRMQSGRQSRVRLPITASILAQMRTALEASSHPHKVALWAIACTAFFGFFRLGELLPTSVRSFSPATDLAWGNIALDNRENPTMVRVHLKKSKCDQFGRGVDVFMGRTHTPLCPVAAILSFMAIRGDQQGPFFLDAQHQTITKAWFVEQIRTILDLMGLPQNQYAGHSFCIGAATTAAVAGVEDSTIQTLGRWHSSAFLQYIRTPKEQLAKLSAIMAAHTQAMPAPNTTSSRC